MRYIQPSESVLWSPDTKQVATALGNEVCVCGKTILSVYIYIYIYLLSSTLETTKERLY